MVFTLVSRPSGWEISWNLFIRSVIAYVLIASLGRCNYFCSSTTTTVEVLRDRTRLHGFCGRIKQNKKRCGRLRYAFGRGRTPPNRTRCWRHQYPHWLPGESAFELLSNRKKEQKITKSKRKKSVASLHQTSADTNYILTIILK